MLNTSRELKQQRTQRLQCKTSAPSVLLVTFFSSLILQSSSVYAEFSVADKSWPKQLPPSEYGVHNHYGNAKDSKFAKAIDSPGEMSAAEKDAIAEMIPESELNRWYAKAGIYSSTFKLSKVKNNTETGQIYNGLNLADGKASSDKKSLLLGVGYTWSTWRMDTELLLGQSLTYSQNPLFDNGLGVLDSKITSNSLIATFYYDFRELFLFKPFVGFSLGAGINKTSGTIDGVALKSSSDFAPAFGIQFGANARILNSNAFIGASYKYLYLGKATFANTDNPISTLKLQGNLISSGFGLNINYLF